MPEVLPKGIIAILPSQLNEATMKIRRLAIFLPDAGGGGAERVMLHLAQGFLSRGHQVDLVLARVAGEYLENLPAGLRVVDLRAGRVLRSVGPLARYLRRDRPHALLAGLNYANLAALAARTLARSSTRLVLSLHNTLTQVRDHPQGLADRVIPTLVRWGFPRAQCIVAVSRGVQEDFCAATGIPVERVSVIYNPVITNEILAQAEQPPAHPWLLEGPPVILGVGRLREQKDFGTLIQAFALLRAKRPVRLLILGEGERRPQLEAMARDLGVAEDVDLPGFLSNPYACMRHAALFALSSKWEGLPTVLIEALACGAPVVSTDCPSGPREILRGGTWGPLVPMEDPAALAQGLEKVLDQPIRPALNDLVALFGRDAAIDAYLSMMLEGL
jgi:glycosyltransferase involved in cell wall biosynthesis